MRFVPSLEAPLPRDAAEGREASLLRPGVEGSCLRPLCLLQRNEPGWFVGEHIHDCRLFAAADDACFREDTLTALPGERAPMVAASLTRLGEAQP
jgi:hypothetical protein